MPLDPRLQQGLVNNEDEEIRKGAELLCRMEPCDDSNRPCQDGFWALLFLLMVGGVGYLSFANSGAVFDLADSSHSGQNGLDPKQQAEAFEMGIVAVLTSGCVAFIGAIMFLQFAKVCTECVVWTALLLGPMIMIAFGFACLAAGAGGEPTLMIIGAVLIALGGCMASCVCCCWKDLIPFTVLLIQTCIDVMQAHPSMMIISMFGSAMSIGWSLLCFFCVMGLYIVHRETIQGARDSAPGADRAMYFAQCFCFLWGSMVASNAAQCACNGVFGRWYFGKDRDSPVSKSLKAAFITSFGSICFGSFIVAFIRALEMVLRQMRRQAQEEGNVVLCIIIFIVEKIIECIGDIIEWFNSFAYVQCAIRGFGFIDSARATYALCKFSNVDLICADSLVGSVVALGSLPCTALATVAALGVMKVMQPPAGANWIFVFTAVMGFIIGMMVAVAALQPLSSGATTFVVCWAENPGALAAKKPLLAQEFAKRGNCWDDAYEGNMQLQPGADPRNVMAVPLTQAGPNQMPVIVPPGVMAGQIVQFQTPHGQLLEVTVPPGYPPGSQFMAAY